MERVNYRLKIGLKHDNKSDLHVGFNLEQEFEIRLTSNQSFTSPEKLQKFLMLTELIRFTAILPRQT